MFKRDGRVFTTQTKLLQQPLLFSRLLPFTALRRRAVLSGAVRRPAALTVVLAVTPTLYYTGSFRPPRATILYEVRAQQETRKDVWFTTVAAIKHYCSPQGARAALHGSQSRSERTHRGFGAFTLLLLSAIPFFVGLWGQTSCDRTESPLFYQLPLFFVIRNLKTGPAYFGGTVVVGRGNNLAITTFSRSGMNLVLRVSPRDIYIIIIITHLSEGTTRTVVGLIPKRAGPISSILGFRGKN